ncbi:MAG: restriction endonuclease subunit S [Gammaproteobacteria bacterium]
MVIYRPVRIGDIGKIVTGKTPITNISEHFGADYMFIGPTDLHKHFFIDKSEKMISKKGLSSIKGCTLNGISILVGCIGWDMGNVALVQETCATNQQINSITNINDGYNPYYIYYWLKTKKEFLFQQANVTRTPILNKGDFSNIEINIPSKQYQDIVAEKLIAIDKKIAVNNKINTELEAMAKLIYDYWFVQFDFPDSNGKPYKSSGGKMVYNEALKREIPEGWDVVPLANIESNIVTGKTPPTRRAEYFNGNVPFICIGDVRGNMHITKTEITLSREGADSQAKKYIPKGAICVTCIASPGLVGFASEESQTNQQLNTVVCSHFENRYYLFFYLTNYFRFAKAKSGNTFANMNKDDFSSIAVIKPRKAILNTFSELLKPSIEKVLLNSKENNKLSELRDWLLPMLMNGQVTVKDTSEVVAV